MRSREMSLSRSGPYWCVSGSTWVQPYICHDHSSKLVIQYIGAGDSQISESMWWLSGFIFVNRHVSPSNYVTQVLSLPWIHLSLDTSLPFISQSSSFRDDKGSVDRRLNLVGLAFSRTVNCTSTSSLPLTVHSLLDTTQSDPSLLPPYFTHHDIHRLWEHICGLCD